MDAIFMSYENSKTLLNLSDKINLKKIDKYVALSNLSVYFTWKNMKQSQKNNNFIILAPTWNDNFDLPDGSYSLSDILDYLEYIIKKHETMKNIPLQ